MSGMIRKLMRNVQRKIAGTRATMSGPAVGSGRLQRAGMHQAAEHEYQRARMAEGVPEPETVEEGLEMPAELESEIPPEEDEDEEVEVVAEGEVAIAPEEEILEEVADPEASVNEEEAAADPEIEEETLGIRNQDSGSSRAALDVDYSGERIPELTPVTGGDSEPRELIYDPGDGSLKEIQEPLPGLGEKLGIPPIITEVINPSANVAAYEEPAPEPEPEPVPES